MVGSEKRNVGFIGIGRMGSRMSKNILKRGYPLLVCDIFPDAYKEHVRLGAQPALTPKDLTNKSDVIVCMLPTPQATENAILGVDKWSGKGVLDGLRPGKIVIDMSTNLPTISKKLAQKVVEKGGNFVDAPVLGSVNPAAEGTLTILPAGEKEVVDSVMPILETMGQKIWYVGPTGMGCSMKLVMNLHLSIVTGAFAESLALGVKAGLDPNLIVEIWNNSIFKTYVTDTKGKKVLKADYTPAFAIELIFKDLDLAEEMAREVNAPIPVSSIIKQLYSACIAAGKKDLDYSALVTLYEQLGNVKVSTS